ncbi:MAG: T9SS type A sorting domain-containing protein [Bacteroidia bacterium]
MKHFSCLILALLSFHLAQSQSVPFTKIFGETATAEQATAVVQLPSGSIFLAGAAEEDTFGGFETVLMKLNPNGDLIWKKFYGTTDQDYANGILLYGDNQLIISGNRTETGTFRKTAFLRAVDTTGKEIWLREYPDSTGGNTYFKTVEKTTDGGLIACGFITSVQGNNSFIVRTDSIGNFLWQGEYSDTLANIAHAARNLPGGGFVVAGDQQRAAGHYNMYIAKFDSDGRLVWRKTIESVNNGGAQNVIVAESGNYLITGESYPSTTEIYFDIYLVMVDNGGQILWDSYIGEPLAEAGYKVFESEAQTFTVCGYGYNFANLSTDMIVIRTDSIGNETDRRYYGTASIDQGFDIVPAAGGGFLAAGFSSGGTDDQYMLVYDQFPPINSTALPEQDFWRWRIYPNPVRRGEIMEIDTPIPVKSIRIVNLAGQLVGENILESGARQLKIHEALTPGIYFLLIETGDKILAKKIGIY